MQKDRVTVALGCLQILQKTNLSSLTAVLNTSFIETDDPTSGHDSSYCTPETGQHTALPASSVIRAIS